MSTLSEIVIDEKELAICLVPLNVLIEDDIEIELEENEMAVYIPKLLASLPYEEAVEEVVNIDYSIIKNEKYPKKKLTSCNYIKVKPYTENNLSPQLFNKGEKCFAKFLYKDIKQAYFSSDILEENEERTTDIKTLSINSDGEKYELKLDSLNKIISLGNSTNNIVLDQNYNSITLSNSSSEISLSGLGVEINSSSINIMGEIFINGISLKDMITEIVKEIVGEGENEI